jgi:hypothetical protein
MEWKNYSKHISAHVERVEVSVEKWKIFGNKCKALRNILNFSCEIIFSISLHEFPHIFPFTFMLHADESNFDGKIICTRSIRTQAVNE